MAVLAAVCAAPSYNYKPSYPTYSGYKDNYDHVKQPIPELNLFS